MKNQAYYDNLIDNIAVTEEHECHIEQQFRDSFWFKVFALLSSGAFIGRVAYSVLFMEMVR